MTMEQVIDSGVIQGLGICALPVSREDSAYYIVHHDTPHRVEELRHVKNSVGLIGLLDYRVLAVGLESGTCGSPDEVRPTDIGVPEGAQAVVDAGTHLLQHLGVPAGPSCLWSLAADNPHGGS